MIEEKDLTAVGKFLKTHALKGELNAILDIDPEFFSEGNPLVIDVEGAFVPFYIESIRGKGASASLIKLEGVDDHEEAKAFVNEIIYVEKDSLKDFMADEEEDLFLEDDLIGYRLVDEEAGEIGEVIRVDSSTVNVLLIIETPEGEELFVPMADDFIKAIDEDKREILTSLPEELLNLNKKVK